MVWRFLWLHVECVVGGMAFIRPGVSSLLQRAFSVLIVDGGRQQESQLMVANQMSEVFIITIIGGRIEGFPFHFRLSAFAFIKYH